MTSLAVIFGFMVITLECCHKRSERKHAHSFSTRRTSRNTSYWLKVCKKILLGLSDTQLLTGLGMQFSVLLLHCTIEIYYFWIAINLTYLSTVTHLLTMVALKRYFTEHLLSSIPRLVLIVFNIGLFCYEAFVLFGLGYIDAQLDRTQRLACYYQSNRPSLKNSSFTGRWFTVIAVVLVIHAIVLWYIIKDVGRERKAQNKWKNCVLRVPIVLVVFYIVFAFIHSVRVLRDTEAMGSPNNLNITIDNTGGNEKDWTFGQILPVLLLALPVLTGWEMIFGMLYCSAFI